MISATEDPVLSILIDNGEWIKHGRQQESEIQNQFPDLANVPFFDTQKVIFAIEKHNAGATYRDLLLELHFTYEYQPDLLIKLISFEPETEFDKTLKSKIVLLNYVALYGKKETEKFQIIVNALFSVLGFEFSEKTLQAIKFLLTDVQKSDIDVMREHVVLLKQLFLDYPEFAKKIQSILPIFLKDLCAKDKQDSSLTEDQQNLITFICGFSQNHLDFFDKKVAAELIYSVTGFLVKLDNYALCLFHSLSPFIDESSAMTLTMLLPMSIRDMIESQPPFLVPKDVNGNVIVAKDYIEQIQTKHFLSYEKTLTGQYTHPPRETFKSGIDIMRPNYLSDRPNCSCLVRPEVYSKLLMIGDGVKTHPAVVKALFEWVSRTVEESTDSPHFFDLAAVFIILFRLCMNYDLVPLFWNTLFNSQLFDIRINMLDGGKIPLFDQLRAFIFSDTASNGFPFLPKMVKSFIKKPELAAEMFRRIIDEFDLIDPQVLKSSSLITNTCSIMVYFQLLDFECPEDQIALVESTRSILLVFILQVLSDTEIAAHWFSCKLFLTSLLELIFEPVLRKHVVDVVKNYIAKEETPKDDVMNEIMNVLNIIFSRFPDERDVLIGCDIVEMVNDAMSLNKSTTSTFIKLNDSLCNALTILDSSPANDAFLIQALHFLALVSPILKLKSSSLQSITESIKAIEKDQISPQVLTGLKQISAGNVISSVMPFYVIKQPKVLKALINVTKHTNAYADCTAFLLMLIEFTYQNSIIVNEAGIDMLLLEIIDSMKSGDIDEKVLNNTFSIITQVSMIVSSTLVVHRFLSLMFPLEGKVLSQYHEFFVKKLNDVTVNAIRSPPAFIPLRVQNCVRIKKVTQELLGKDFGVYFWIYADRAVTQVRSTILEIYDSKGKGFNIFISSGTLLVTCFGKNMESTTHFDEQLPRGSWTFICFHAWENNKGRVSVSAMINESISRKVDFKYKWMKPGPLKIIVGSMGSSNQMDEYDVSPILLSNVTFFSGYNIEDIKSDIETGPRVRSVPNVILSLSFIDREGIVQPEIYSPDKSISANIIGGNIECHTTFIDVLCSMCKVKALIPLFSMLDLKTKNGKQFTELPVLLINLLSETLSISTSVQKSFYNSGGMKIISYLIQESKIFPHNYPMYMRLYQMMSTITDNTLQCSVIESILCNFSLLTLYDPKSQLRIIKHWRRVIIQVYPTQFTEAVTIRKLIYAMNTYYDKGVNVETMRQEIFYLIVELSAIDINEDDILALVSEAISTKNVQREKRVLKCLADIFSCEQGTCVDKLKFRITHIVLLNGLISTADDEILLLITQIIASIHRLQLLPAISSQMHFELIMQNISPKCCSHDSAVELATMANNFSHSILPLCLYVAINVDESAMYDVLDELQPCTLTFHDIIWVVAIVDRSPSDIGKKGLTYLMNCDAEWSEVINAIIIVTKSLGSDPHSLINEYLSIIYTKIVKDLIPHEVDKFFTLAFNELFFHTFTISSALEKEFKTSPFSIPKSVEEESSDDCTSEGGSFLELRTRSMMSRSFLFISGENEKDEIDGTQEHVTKSLSESNILLSDIPKIELDTRKFSYDKEVEAPSSLKDTSSSSKKKLSSSTKSHSFLYIPPTEAKLTFSMNDLYSNIELFTKKKKESLFSVRLDRNGRWLDIDLALLCLKLYPKVNSPLHFGFILLVADILLRFQPIQIERFFKAINPTPSMLKNCRNQLSMIKIDIQKRNLRMDIKLLNSVQANYEWKNEALQAMATSRSKVHTYTLYNNAEAIMNESLKMVQMQSEFICYENVESIGFSMKETRKFSIQEQRNLRDQQTMWSRLWNSLTMELALWEGAAQKKTVATYIRDYHLCPHLAPVKDKYTVSVHKPITKLFTTSPTSIDCTVIEPTLERKCSIEVTKFGINLTNEYGTKHAQKSSIKYILPIDRYNGKFSIEIFYSSGKVHILDFATLDNQEKFMQSCRTLLNGIEFIAQPDYHPIDFLNAVNAVERWKNGSIPNFEYLMLVNFAAGRVFADKNLYPIFPWVITDFTSKSLDLSDEKIYRDLSQRIGIRPENSYMFNNSPLTCSYLNKIITSKHTLKELFEMSEENSFELPPEFFCYPEMISSSVELPPWASSAQDFVYKQRSALESEFVSSKLHLWIDNFFGIKLSEVLYDPEVVGSRTVLTDYPISFAKGVVPKQIFTKNHLTKLQTLPSKSAFSKEMSLNMEMSGVLMSHITNETKTTIDLLIVFETGAIKHGQIDLEKMKFSFLSNLIIMPFLTDSSQVVDKSVLPAVNQNGTIVPVNGGFVSTTGISPVIGVTLGGKCKTLKITFGFVSSLSSNGNHIAAVCTDMTTRIWDITAVQKSDESPKCVISSYRDCSICSAVSESFSIVVTGTRDGSLQIGSLSGNIQKIVDLCERKPLKVLITESLGFIVVYAERTGEAKRGKEIIVYTVNGLFVKRINTSDIECWVSWEDSRGIDYIAVAFNNGKLQIFEVGNLLLSLTQRCDSIPASLEYAPTHSVIVATSKKGAITLIPTNV